MKAVGYARRIITGAGAVLWIAAPILALTGLLFANTQLRLSEPVDIWVTAETASSTSSTPVELALKWSSPSAVVAPVWDGIVQNVYVTPGGEISSGQKIVRINGVDRIAFAGKAPFWRPIGSGMAGDDVEDLNRLLATLGFRHGPAATVTAETMAGIEQLRRYLGATDHGVFRPDWSIHLSNRQLTVEQTEVTVASPAPAAGAKLFTAAARLTEARLVVKGTLPLQNRQPKEQPDKASPTEVSNTGGRAYSVPVQGRVLSAGTPLPVDASRQRIGAEGLPALQAQLESGASSASAFVETPVPAGSIVLPAAAVRSGISGNHCVIRALDGGTAKVRVDVVGEALGRVIVAGEILPGQPVLASSGKTGPCE
jgi:hypothetical protein